MVRSLHRILVPLDGSALAEQALPTAVTLAVRAHAPIELVGVQPLVAEYLMRGEPVVTGGFLERDAAGRLEEYLATAAASLRNAAEVAVTHRLLLGQPAAKIAAHAKARKAGLIVMTTHGRGGLTRLWLGSVADQLLRLAETPVLLLHPDDARKPPVFSSLLVALDRSSLSGQVLKHGLAFASLTPGTRISLGHVVEPPLPLLTGMSAAPEALDPDVVREVVTPAREHFEAVADRLQRQGHEVSTHLPVGVAVGRVVCELAERLPADLIVIGTHGWKGARRLLLGSVADKVVRGAPCPVLVIPLAAALRKAAAAEKPAVKRREKVVFGV